MSPASSARSSPDGLDAFAALIVAAGTGTRLGGEIPKQYLGLRGRPILEWAIRAFLGHPALAETIVVLPPAAHHASPAWLLDLPVRLVSGGSERSDSVWNGLCAVSPGVPTVLIHDGARPLVSREVIERVLSAARLGAVIAALPVADTIKEVDPVGRGVMRTPDRSRLWAAQTPQGFPLPLILEAHRRARAAGEPATDDAALVERLGEPVFIVEGAPENLKITRRIDLVVAEALASQLLGD